MRAVDGGDGSAQVRVSERADEGRSMRERPRGFQGLRGFIQRGPGLSGKQEVARRVLARVGHARYPPSAVEKTTGMRHWAGPAQCQAR